MRFSALPRPLSVSVSLSLAKKINTSKKERKRARKKERKKGKDAPPALPWAQPGPSVPCRPPPDACTPGPAVAAPAPLRHSSLAPSPLASPVRASHLLLHILWLGSSGVPFSSRALAFIYRLLPSGSRRLFSPSPGLLALVRAPAPQHHTSRP